MAYVTWLPSFRAGEPVGIRVVGGGALALRYFERRTTVDIDVVQVTPGDEIPVIAAVERIADRRGWQRDWLNLKAAGLAPSHTLGQRSQSERRVLTTVIVSPSTRMTQRSWA